MKFVALKELPQGQQPGDVFEATEAQGNVLILVGAAKLAKGDETPEPTRRTYRRRDLKAEA
jgi:hypothetical protein